MKSLSKPTQLVDKEEDCLLSLDCFLFMRDVRAHWEQPLGQVQPGSSLRPHLVSERVLFWLSRLLKSSHSIPHLFMMQ